MSNSNNSRDHDGSASSAIDHDGSASSAIDHDGSASSAIDHDISVSSAIGHVELESIKKYGNNLLKFPTLKFNEKIINPHIEAKILTSKYKGCAIKSVVYETVYNTVLYIIFINSINIDSFLVVDDNILHGIKKDLITFASICAETNVIKNLRLKTYRKISHTCKKRKCVGCISCTACFN